MAKREDFPPDQRKAPVSPPTPPAEVIPVEELVSDADPTLEWSIADLASDELIEIVGAENMDEATANDVIMAARAHWFEAEAAPQEAQND